MKNTETMIRQKFSQNSLEYLIDNNNTITFSASTGEDLYHSVFIKICRTTLKAGKYKGKEGIEVKGEGLITTTTSKIDDMYLIQNYYYSDDIHYSDYSNDIVNDDDVISELYERIVQELTAYIDKKIIEYVEGLVEWSMRLHKFAGKGQLW